MYRMRTDSKQTVFLVNFCIVIGLALVAGFYFYTKFALDMPVYENREKRGVRRQAESLLKADKNNYFFSLPKMDVQGANQSVVSVETKLLIGNEKHNEFLRKREPIVRDCMASIMAKHDLSQLTGDKREQFKRDVKAALNHKLLGENSKAEIVKEVLITEMIEIGAEGRLQAAEQIAKQTFGKPEASAEEAP